MVTVYVGSVTPIHKDWRIVMGVGGYLEVDFEWEAKFGKSPNKNDLAIETSTHKGISDIKDASYRGWDYGISALFGLEYQWVQVGLNYYYGLCNVVKNSYPLYNRSLRLSLILFIPS